jgi:hypothetical protein
MQAFFCFWNRRRRRRSGGKMEEEDLEEGRVWKSFFPESSATTNWVVIRKQLQDHFIHLCLNTKP